MPPRVVHHEVVEDRCGDPVRCFQGWQDTDQEVVITVAAEPVQVGLEENVVAQDDLAFPPCLEEAYEASHAGDIAGVVEQTGELQLRSEGVKRQSGAHPEKIAVVGGVNVLIHVPADNPLCGQALARAVIDVLCSEPAAAVDMNDN